jgi:hypothetical protein
VQRTKVEYRATLVRVQGIVFAILAPLFGAALLSVLHATNVSCSRAEASCTITSHSIFMPFRRHVVPLDEVVELAFDMKKSPKGGMYAEAWLVTKTLGRFPLNDGILTRRTEPGDANVAAGDLKAFLGDPHKPAVDVWLWSPTWGTVITTFFGFLVMLYAQAIVREQVAQLFPIRVFVDHDAKRLILPRRKTVAFDDVVEVGVQRGRALGWVSNKGEHIPGYRIIVRKKDGKVIPLTRDYRVGPAELHENAKNDILRAMGRDLRDG